MQKVLVANRGEIAVRIIRAARDLGLSTVAVYTQVDEGALHARVADEAVLLEADSPMRGYLDVDLVVQAALDSGADAVHPGYGFLSERAAFSEKVTDAGLVFVGPSPDSIRLMGDKAAARAGAERAGVPTVPGSDGPVEDRAAAQMAAEVAGYPVAVKAAAGGGGRGIRIVESPEKLAEAVSMAQAEADKAFGSPQVYIERFIPRARHIEVQVFGDGEHFVHFGERECSLQRRRQKVLEESPAPGLPSHVRKEMTDAAVRVTEAVQYTGAGTVEFLYDSTTEEFFFIEMNTRIQVEHPVTEMVTGIDLVREQLAVAGGAPLSVSQEEIEFRGHAIEIRLNAEDPHQGFMPSPGTLETLRLPAGPFVRVDSGFEPGSDVSPFYDSLLAKVIVWGDTRGVAVSRLRRAMDEIKVEGVHTTAGFLRSIIDLPEFGNGGYHTTFLESLNGNAS